MAAPEMTGVEQPAITWLVALGYEYLPGSSVKQEHKNQVLILEDVLCERLLVLNPWLAKVNNGVAQALRQLRNVWTADSSQDSAMQTNQVFWRDLLMASNVQVHDTQADRKRSVKFFDPINTKNNKFHVVNQYIGENAQGDEFKPDLLLFINGIPLGVVECKKSSEKISKGIDQLLGYQQHFPRHFSYQQVCAVVNRVEAKYGTLGTPETFYFYYKLEQAEEQEVKRLLPASIGSEPTEQDKLLWALFEPSRFLRLVCHFVIFEQEKHGLVKKLPRYQQWRAVEKTMSRLTANTQGIYASDVAPIEGSDGIKYVPETGGVVWHTQGSGKSLTMAMLARLLRSESAGLDNPSILVLTDRTDLDDQISNTFSNVGLQVTRVPSVSGLEKLLSNDYGSIFTSTVHKFQDREEETPEQAEKKAIDSWQIHVSPNTPDIRIRKRQGNGKIIVAEERNINFAKMNEQTNTDSQYNIKAKWQVIRKYEEPCLTRTRKVADNDDYFIIQERNANFEQLDTQGNLQAAKWIEESREQVTFTTLSNKSNFYVLVDEAHRSQYGFLAAFMRASLPNAKFIAFTGTPLQKDERNTLGEFGGKDYIDTYKLHEAVADGATLPIQYNEGLAPQSVSDELDSAFKDAFGEEEKAKQKALQQALLKKRRLSKGRIEENAKYLVTSFIDSVKAKGFKAMLVADGRAMAIRYQEAILEIMAERRKQGLDTFESKVIISQGGITENRSSEIKEGAAVYKIGDDTIDTSDFDLRSIEQRIREEIQQGIEPIAVPSDDIPNMVNELFKLPYGDESQNTEQQTAVSNIGLLIVSDMLLTGYDAPILSTLYLDRSLKEHTLLQAIARVNRTCNKPKKNAGYIVDFHGIVENLDEALRLYGGDVTPEQVWSSVDTELPKLEAALQKLLDMLPQNKDIIADQQGYLREAEQFLDPDVRLDVVDEYLSQVNDFNRLIDVVLPNPKGAPFKPYFYVFNELKAYLRNKLPDTAHQVQLNNSESALLQHMVDEYLEADEVRSLLGHEISILNVDDFERLKKLKDVGSKALVMKNQLKHVTKTGKKKDPGFFGALEKELNKLLEDEKAKRIDQIIFLQQLELLTQKIHNKDNAAQEKGFTEPAQIAIYNYLKTHFSEEQAHLWAQKIFEDEEIATTLASGIWKQKADVYKPLAKKLRSILRGVSNWSPSVAKAHSETILETLKNN